MDIETGSNLEVMPPGTPVNCMSPDIKQHEPPMFVARPSSDQAQDVSHILADVFKDLYTRDVMSKDTVKNLTCSSEGSTKFHKKCMDQLNKVHADHQRKMEEYNMLEKQIIQARARAASADTKALEHAAGNIGSERYEQLGLPPVQSHFQWCLEEQSLKEHKLIVPSDLFQKDHQLMEGPTRRHTPHFSLPTVSSSLHFLKEKLDDGYSEPEEQKVYVSFETAINDEKSTLSSDSVELVSVPPRTPINKKENVLSKKDRWRENMKHETRIEDRALLARLEERHNFLKNPRYLPVTETKLLTKEHPKQMILKAGREISQIMCKEDVQVFECNPAIVSFTDWIVGRVYECVLEVRNISSVSRQLRVLPPKTAYFSLGLGKYPGAEGVVAPGMNAQYNIRFMPDSLCNYSDEIEVVSQSASPLVVTIQGKRPPPVLSITETLQCGYCLVGGVKMTELPIKNFGGSGRFCVVRKSSWPASNFKTLVNPGCLDVGPFKIRPAVFEIMAGQKMNIELFFSPHCLGKFKEELVIVCDNCQVKYFTIEGEGESASVELVSVSDDGLKEPGIHEIKDTTADHLVKFPLLNPHSFYMRQLILHNAANVELPFSWHILKPNLAPTIKQLSNEDRNEKVEFYPDLDSSFFIEPKEGVLQPNGIHEFVLTFAPNKVEHFHNVFHLVLSNIPDVKKETNPKSSEAGRDTKSDKKGFEEAAPRLARSNSGTAYNTPQLLPLREVIALEVEVKGESIPYSVLLHPPAVMVPGNILTGTTMKRPLRMANYSLAPVEFQWSNESSPNIVEIEPPLGLINPGEVAELEVSVTGLKPGPLSCQLICNIEHQEKPMYLNVSAEIMGPTVVIDNVSINFDLIKLDDCVTEEVFIRNTTQLNAQWNLSLTNPLKFGDVLFISPSCGELGPLQRQSIKVTFKPNKCQSVNTTIQLDVKGGKSSSVAVKGEVQTQQACFDDCTVVFKDIFLSVPKRGRVTLVNQTLFPTAFWFKDLHGKQSSVCEITTEPKQGILKPREELKIEVTAVMHAKGEVSELYLPCVIEGMKMPIVLGFYADVGCLNAVFSTPDNDNSEELKVVFGESVAVGKYKTSRILIMNTTAIRAPWSASIKTYKGQQQSLRKSKHDFKSVKSRRAMLGRTPNLADPLSKTPAQAFSEYAKLLLGQGKGCAFTLEPSKGYLDPYQTQEITVACYNDMWGKYDDEITCRVEGLDEKKIPVHVNVTGCPLSFQIANQVNEYAVVRYGTHLEGGATVARKLQINNSSSIDIRLDWKTYNSPKPEDKKIVDINVWFGEDFPKLKGKDGHGKSATSSLHDIPAKMDEDRLRKLVNVRIEPHFGERSEIPFHIEPSQIVVPAHGRAMVAGIFKPIIGGPCVDDEYTWKSYGLGYMSLDEVSTKGENNDQLSRCDGYSVEPLRIEFRSTVRAGMLDVNVDVDDENTFFQPLSNLLDDNSELKNESIQLRRCVFTNTTDTPLSFHLSTETPFFMTSSTAPASPRATHLARNLLLPQTSLQSFPPSLIYLNISDNRIDDFETNTFDGLTQLKTLNMDGLMTAKTSRRQFRALGSLKELSMGGKIIEVINERLFSFLPTLEKLSLTQTKLESLPVGLFAPLESLRELNLNDNMLSYISPNTFLANSRIIGLELDNNRLNELENLTTALSLLGNLVTLSLAGNGIQDQPNVLIERLDTVEEIDLTGNMLAALTANLTSTSLRLLNLSSNQISSIEDHVFSNLNNVTAVDLSGNQLTSLPTINTEEMRAISQLVVSGNNWNCDCDLLLSYMQYKQENINLDCTFEDSFNQACIVCTTPVSLEGKLISQLESSDVSNCSATVFPTSQPPSTDIIGIMLGIFVAIVLAVAFIIFLRRGGMEKVKTFLGDKRKKETAQPQPSPPQPEIAEYGSIDTVPTPAYSLASERQHNEPAMKQISQPPQSPLNLYQPASPIDTHNPPKSSAMLALPQPSMFHEYESIKSVKKTAQRESSLNPYIFPESEPNNYNVATPSDSDSPYLAPMQSSANGNPYEIPMTSAYLQFNNVEKASNLYELDSH